MNYTPDEIMVCCISREIQDYDVLIQGISTPLVASGYMLAKKLHAPNSVFGFAVGNSVVLEPAPLSLRYFEDYSLKKAIHTFSFVEFITQVLSSQKRLVEFFRPAQVDTYGNMNTVVIGDYKRPKIRLPGAAGLPEVTQTYHEYFIYVPRQDERVFVENLDFLNGVGFLSGQSTEERRKLGIKGGGPKRVVTDLGVFGFDDKTKRMKLLTVHPHSSVEEILEKTGFEFSVEGVRKTKPPTEKELKVLREEVDPLGLRELETIPSFKRASFFMELLEKDV
ncbi:MAG: CoA-transferase subunit beta [Candidatus Methanofastidiosia archaeon]